MRLAWLIRLGYFAWYMPRRTDGANAMRLVLGDRVSEGVGLLMGRSRRLAHAQRAVAASADRSRLP